MAKFFVYSSIEIRPGLEILAASLLDPPCSLPLALRSWSLFVQACKVTTNMIDIPTQTAENAAKVMRRGRK